MNTIKIILADDHTLVRAGLCRLLQTFGGVLVVGEASNADQALELAFLVAELIKKTREGREPVEWAIAGE